MPRATKRKADDQLSDISNLSKRHPSPPRLRSRVTNIEMLPTEMLLQIFRYVPIAQWTTLEAVSPRFRDTTYEVWKSLEKLRIFDDLFASTKYFGDTRVDENRLKMLNDKLSSRATNLSQLSGFWELNLSSMHMVNLKQLCLVDFGSFVNMRVGDLAMFLEESESRDRLRTLCIPDTIFTEASSSPVIDRLANAFKNVGGGKQLQLEAIRIKKVTVNIARSIGCLLESIDTTRLTSFLAPGIGISQFQLRSFIERATNLRRLAFSFVCVCGRFQGAQIMTAGMRMMKIKVLEAIGKLEQLEALTIGSVISTHTVAHCDCRNVSDAMSDLFRSIGNRCKRDDDGETRRTFRILGLLQSFGSRKFVEPIAEYLPNLERLTLEIDRLDGATLSTVLASQQKLKSLWLLATDRSIPHNANGYVRIEDVLRSKSTLEDLRLNLLNVGKIIGDVKQLSQCERLGQFTFNVPFNRLVTEVPVDDVELLSWADGFGANLTKFGLGGRFFISDKGFGQFLARASRLECLTMYGLPITDELLRDLPDSCPKLMELQMGTIHNKLTKVGVQAALDGCPGIKLLTFKALQDSPWFPSKLKLDKYRRVCFK